MIIDIHGHYTTEPQPLLAFRDKQLAGLADPMRKPATNDLGITDEQLVESVAAAAQAAEGARLRPHHLLAARRRHGAPRRHRGDRHRVVAHVERPHPPHLHAAARQLRAGRPAAAASRRAAEELHPRARAPGRSSASSASTSIPIPSGGYWTDPPLTDKLVVSALREAGRARHAGDDPRHLVVQPERSITPARITSTATPPPSCSSSRATCSRISRR